MRVGLQASGISYTLGFAGAGTPRANPCPLGLPGFIDLAEQVGAQAISLPTDWLEARADTELRELTDRFHDHDCRLIVDGSVMGSLDASLAMCTKMGVTLMRSTLTSVLEGGRAAQGAKWSEMVHDIRRALPDAAAKAGDHGVTIALENHQDFTSVELREFCEVAGHHIGVCFDVGNSLAVGEDPVLFTRLVAPYVALLHLKDYRVKWTDEGYRLVRCAIGDGAVPFKEVAEALESVDDPRSVLPALIEPGALGERHIRVLCDDWWDGYPPRTARELAVGLAAARKGLMPEAEDWRTPWDAGAGSEEVIAYEMQQLHKSVANMKSLGLMTT